MKLHRPLRTYLEVCMRISSLLLNRSINKKENYLPEIQMLAKASQANHGQIYPHLRKPKAHQLLVGYSLWAEL